MARLAAISCSVEMVDPFGIDCLPSLAVLGLHLWSRQLERFRVIIILKGTVRMLSDALRLIRVFHDLKQQDLADRLDISKSYLSEIENGKKIPSVEIIEKYARLFSIPPSSIMFFAESVSDGKVVDADSKVRLAIADKVVQFLKFVEAKTSDRDDVIRT